MSRADDIAADKASMYGGGFEQTMQTTDEPAAREFLVLDVQLIANGYRYKCIGKDLMIFYMDKEPQESWFDPITVQVSHGNKISLTSAYMTAHYPEKVVSTKLDKPMSILGMEIKTDPKLADNEIRFDYPDGRSEGVKIS